MAVSASLLAVLEKARDRGFLGPQPIEQQVEHALGFADVVVRELAACPAGSQVRVVDVGSGAGLPGLVMVEVPELLRRVSEVVLLDGSARRADWLREAVGGLNLGDRVGVRGERAEVAGRELAVRGTFSVAVARSFGRPAVVAECAAPLLCAGGFLVVSEPPESEPRNSERWPTQGLGMLGFAPAVPCRARGFGFVTMSLERLCDQKYPRRNGLPNKRPLF
ncbi:MAG: RsmG family class I SAM-dependent methyltransferase [Acidimicrobiales bacterium]